MMGYGYGSSMAWLGMGLGMILHLAFTALIIMAVIWMFKTVFRGGCRAHSQTGALDILKGRYARGEITSEEYHCIRKELE